jgi:hypothetical protein
VLNSLRSSLARWISPSESATKAGSTVAEKVRVIQHLSCTGGTLFTKCLAAQPGVRVLNEIDPFSQLPAARKGEPKFAPSDIIALVRFWKGFSTVALVEEMFLRDIEFLVRKTTAKRKFLLLRAHAHAAYLTGPFKRATPALNTVLQKKFKVLSIVTVRNPIDSYLSLEVQQWKHFQPSTFEEYCQRYLAFLKDHETCQVFRYEDLVENPIRTIKAMCTALELKYNPGFVDHFSDQKLSGDSGRSGAVIEPRERREYGGEFAREVSESPSFRTLRARLNYGGLDQ